MNGRRAGSAVACLCLLVGGTTGAEPVAAPGKPAARVARFDDAVARYKSGDVAGASDDFLLMANAGLATAAMNLSVIAASGDRAVDRGEALGWLAVARELGATVKDSDIQRLNDAAGAAGKSRADAIVAHYGREAVSRRLKEEVEACRKPPIAPSEVASTPEVSERTPPGVLRINSSLPNRYPARGLEEGLPSMVVVHAWIDVDGRAKHAHVEASFPTNWKLGFQEAAIVTVLHGEFTPATLHGQPIGSWLVLKVRFSADAKGGDMLRKGALDKLHAAAIHDDAVAGALWTVMADLGETRDYIEQSKVTDADELLISSALKGYPKAEADLSLKLCAPESQYVWSLRSLSDGDDRMLSVLAEYEFDRTHDPVRTAQLQRYFDAAATSGNPILMRKIVWIRAAARDAGLRDPQGAVRLGWSLLPDKRDDPDFALAYAAAQAAAGNFRGAQEAQAWAMNKAKRLGWDVAPIQATMMKYAAGQQDPARPAEFKDTFRPPEARLE